MNGAWKIFVSSVVGIGGLGLIVSWGQVRSTIFISNETCYHGSKKSKWADESFKKQDCVGQTPVLALHMVHLPCSDRKVQQQCGQAEAIKKYKLSNNTIK